MSSLETLFGLVLGAITFGIAFQGRSGVNRAFPTEADRPLFRASAFLYFTCVLVMVISPLMMAISTLLFAYADHQSNTSEPHYVFTFVYHAQVMFCEESHLLCDKSYLFDEMDAIAMFVSSISIVIFVIGIYNLIRGEPVCGIWSTESIKRRLLRDNVFFYKTLLGLLLLGSGAIYVHFPSYYKNQLPFDKIIHTAPTAAVVLIASIFTWGVVMGVELFLLIIWMITRKDNVIPANEF